MKPRMEPGCLEVTDEVCQVIGFADIQQMSGRHLFGDYGEVSEYEKIANDYCVETGGDVFSLYTVRGKYRVAVHTDAGRTRTLFALLEEAQSR